MHSLVESKPFSPIDKSCHKPSHLVEYYTPCCKGSAAQYLLTKTLIHLFGTSTMSLHVVGAVYARL